MTNRRYLIPLLILSLVVPALAAGRDAIVGTWSVTVTPDEDAIKAGEKEYKDTLTFKGMQLTSDAMKKKGFDSAEYSEDTRAGIAATFKCDMKSKSQGTATWTGTSQANTLKGELSWTKADGTVMKYSYTGERKS